MSTLSTFSCTSSESGLLARLRAGEDAAYRDLVAQFGGRLLATTRRLLCNEEDARDALQDAMLSAFRALARFDGRSALSTWLHRIAVNAALIHLRKKRGRGGVAIEDLLPTFGLDGQHAEPPVAFGEVPDDPVARREVCEEVRAAIATLPERYRTALLRRDIEGATYEALAAEMGITVNAAKIRVHRGRQALRALLAPRHESLC